MYLNTRLPVVITVIREWREESGPSRSFVTRKCQVDVDFAMKDCKLDTGFEFITSAIHLYDIMLNKRALC